MFTTFLLPGRGFRVEGDTPPTQLVAAERRVDEYLGDLASTDFHPATKLAYQRHVFKKPRFWTAVSIQERTARQ